MANKQDKEIFEPYLKKQYAKDGAVTYGAKLETVKRLIAETKQGIVPIAGGQRINLDENNPAVKGIREGKKVAVDGKKAKAAGGVGSNWTGIAGIAVFLVPIVGLVIWLLLPDAEPEAVAVVEPTVTIEATETAYPTETPVIEEEPEVLVTAEPTVTSFPTYTPVPVEPSEYEVKVSDEASVADFHQPIAMNLAGREMRIATAKYGADWSPAGVEWWPKTDVRKVITVPFEEGLIQEVFQTLDRPVTIRLRNGAAIQYQIDDIQRVNTFEIEKMLSNVPSVAIIFHGEEGDERWLVTGLAIQEEIQVEDVQILEEITFLTVDGCDQNNMLIECTINIGEEDQYLIDQLVLTDMDWWEGGSYPLSEIKSVTCNSGNCSVILAGVARHDGTAVIIHDVDGEVTVQILPTTN